MKPKLVLIAFAYPPCTEIGGVRATNMARSLANVGWKVDVVTPTIQHWGATDWKDDSLHPDIRTVRVDGKLSFLGDEANFKQRGIAQKLLSYVFTRYQRNFRQLESLSLIHI